MASSGLQDYHPAPDNPHTWMKFVGKISFLFGFWALFVFFKVFIYIQRCIHSILGNMNFRSSTPISCWMDQSILGNSHWWNSSLSSSWYKKQLLRLVVSRLIFNSIFFNCSFFQMLSIRGVIPCIPYISGKAKGFLILASVVAVEALIFGVIQFAYYYRCFCNNVWPHSLTNWCC